MDELAEPTAEQTNGESDDFYHRFVQLLDSADNIAEVLYTIAEKYELECNDFSNMAVTISNYQQAKQQLNEELAA